MIDFLTEFLEFLRQRRKLWLLPVIFLLLLIGMLFVLAQGSIMSPFIYTLY
ncbi:MAG: DUF5989 family protein [Fluviicoccus sp.]|uniref:DUF5989 family protein n=1 Tax=Fluviicoccus sp. TaxID=2003552 RepID=UPI002719E303|nr:DUF5989 family protein [Fluviicoccus sp.]MDO8330282.1 DUF5989 family protein [Fluviicoccus sp.]